MLATSNTLQINLNRYSEAQADNSQSHTPTLSTNIQPSANLQHIVLEYNVLDFDPKLLLSVDFPKDLISLAINIKGAIPQERMKDIGYIIHLGRKLRGLNNLKTLSIKLPTTSHTNQMIHNMPSTLTNIEDLELEFIEPEGDSNCEEFYVNSCLEWISGMTNLRRMRLRSTRLNYTYCSFMKLEDLTLGNLTKLEWTDDILSKGLGDDMRIQGDSWIECKKEDDLNVVLGLLAPEKVESLELPLVFDGLSGEFALAKFLQLLEKLSVLKELKLSIGFKLLEESDISAVEEALKLIKSKTGVEHVSIAVYYRELSKDIPAVTFSVENRQKNV